MEIFYFTVCTLHALFVVHSIVAMSLFFIPASLQIIIVFIDKFALTDQLMKPIYDFLWFFFWQIGNLYVFSITIFQIDFTEGPGHKLVSNNPARDQNWKRELKLEVTQCSKLFYILWLNHFTRCSSPPPPKKNERRMTSSKICLTSAKLTRTLVYSFN